MGNFQSAGPTGAGLVLEESLQLNTVMNAWMAKNGNALRASSAVFKAVLERDAAALHCALAKNRPTPVSRSEGFAPLHVCVVLGWMEGAIALVEAGADPNCRSSQEYTPLHLAAGLSNLQAVTWLTEHGAQVNARTRRGHVALHWACQSATAASKGVMRHLLECGATATVHGHRHRTPLQVAVCAHGDVEVVRTLLERGADPSEPNPANHYATPLHASAHLGRIDCMEVLLRAGANPNMRRTDDGMTPLLEVFRYQHGQHGEAKRRALARLLLHGGANPNLTPPSGFGLLHHAFQVCREAETISLLLDAGLDASINVDKPLADHEPGARTRCLHVAARRGWSGLVARLLLAGADPELKDSDGFASLHMAVIQQHTDVVACLLAGGADPLARCPDIYPSYPRYCLERGLQAMHALLQMEGPPINLAQMMEMMHTHRGATATAVDIAVSTTQHLPTVEAFVAAGVRPSVLALTRGAAGTPIMRAVVERQMWTPELHRRLPPRFRVAARTLLLCLNRAATHGQGQPLALPPDCVSLILHKAAYPLSAWASPLWFSGQRLRQAGGHQPGGRAAGGPNAVIAPGFAQAQAQVVAEAIAAGAAAAQAGAAGAAGGAGVPAGGANPAAPALPADLGALVHHVVQALQGQGGLVHVAQHLLDELAPGLGAGMEEEGAGDEGEEPGGGGGAGPGQQGLQGYGTSDDDDDGDADGEQEEEGGPLPGHMHVIQVEFHLPLAQLQAMMPGNPLAAMFADGPLPGQGGLPAGMVAGVPGLVPMLGNDGDEEGDDVPALESSSSDSDSELPHPLVDPASDGEIRSTAQQQNAGAGASHAEGRHGGRRDGVLTRARARRSTTSETEVWDESDEAGPSNAAAAGRPPSRGAAGRRRSSSPASEHRFNLRPRKKPRGD